MNKHYYNFSIVLGLIMILVGIGLWNIPIAVSTTGFLIIMITIYGAERATRKINVPE